MKINDNDFLQKIWEFQLNNLSKSVLTRYVGGTHAVVKNDDYWRLSAQSMHTLQRDQITDKLGKQQAYKRIRALIKKGTLKWSHFDCCFYINTEQGNLAFNAAREFWLANNVPTGWCSASNSMRTAKVADYDYLVNECHKALLRQFVELDFELIKEA